MPLKQETFSKDLHQSKRYHTEQQQLYETVKTVSVIIQNPENQKRPRQYTMGMPDAILYCLGLLFLMLFIKLSAIRLLKPIAVYFIQSHIYGAIDILIKKPCPLSHTGQFCGAISDSTI